MSHVCRDCTIPRCRIYEQSVSTPYIPFLCEIGLWTVKYQLIYKRVLLLKRLFSSDQERIARKVLKTQMTYEKTNCWYSEVKDSMEKIGCNDLEIRNGIENNIKKKLKVLIKEQMEQQLEECGGKSRFIKEWGEKDYFKILNKKK